MKSKKNKVRNETYEDLYICLHNADQKRQDLLNGIKNSLVMQGEYEQILAIRKEKYVVLKNIKKLLTKTNRKYQELRKNLPNVRNIISYTEKELLELEEQIKMLKLDSTKVAVDIVVDKDVKKKLEKSNKGLREELARSKDKKAKLKKAPVVKPEKKSKSKLTRLDRIKNNLNVIESKLKDI